MPSRYFAFLCLNCEDVYTICHDNVVEACKEIIDEGWRMLDYPLNTTHNRILWLCPPCKEAVSQAGDVA